MRKFVLAILMFGLVLPAMAQTADTASIRVAHFAVDSGPVDVYVNGDAVVEGLEFGDVTDWMEVEAGTYDLAIAPAGTSLGDSAAEVTDVSVEAGDWMSAVAIGEAARDTLALQVLEENFSEITEGEARISVFHAIAGGPPVNVMLNDVELVRLLGYPGYFGPESDGFFEQDVLAQDYAITVTLEDGTPVVEIEDVTFGSQRHYFVGVVGTPVDPTYVLVVTDPAAMMAEAGPEIDAAALGTGSMMVRVAQFSPGSPAYDVYLDGEAVAEGADFPSIGEWMEMSAGVYDVMVTEAGDDEALLETQVGLATDTRVTLAVIGSLDTENLSVQPLVEDFSETETGFVRIGVFHAIPNAAPVDVLVNDNLMVQTLGYPGFVSPDSDGFASFDLVAEPITVSFVIDDTEVINTGEIVMTPNANYFVAAVGLADNPLFLVEKTEMGQ